MNKIALVTGSSRGIGSAIVRQLSLDGYFVVITYKTNKDSAEEVLKDIISLGGSGIVCSLDVSDRKSVRDVLNVISDQYGKLDVLVNNAAIIEQKDFMDITDCDWDEIFNTNIKGTFICSQEVLKRFMLPAKKGKIINISSIGGQWGGQLAVHYAASKAAVINFTRSMAKLYSSMNIQTNCISPGLVPTDMTSKELSSDFGKKKAYQIPSGRLGSAQDIAHSVSFLVSEKADYITGQTINVNGGMYFD